MSLAPIYVRRLIRLLAYVVAALVAITGSLDVLHEPPDFTADLWLVTPWMASVPSWFAVAVLIAPMPNAQTDGRRSLLANAYVALVIFTATYALLDLSGRSHSAFVSLMHMPLLTFLTASANALVLRHSPSTPDNATALSIPEATHAHAVCDCEATACSWCGTAR